MIDEFSELLSTYISRENNIVPFIEDIKDLPNVTYVSATPLDDELMPDFLKDKERYDIDWSDSKFYKEKKVILLAKTNKPKVTAKNVILSFLEKGYIELNGKRAEELFVFINSVSMIIDIINNMELPKELYKVICANTQENKEKLEQIGAEIDLDFMNNKKINFITSTAFLGCDFYSDNGLKIIVTDTNKRYSMLDVNTQILQINGRIRNDDNPFRNMLLHISNFKFDSTGDSELNDKYEMSVKIAGEYIKESDGVKKYYRKLKDELFLKETKNGDLVFNDIRYKAEKLKNNVYNVQYINPEELKEEYKDYGISSRFYLIKEDDTIKSIIKDKTKKDYYELYETAKNMRFSFEMSYYPLLADIKKKDNQIPEEVDCLGIDKIRALRYSKPKIREEVNFRSDEFKEAVMDKLKLVLKKEVYSSDEIKDILNEIYIGLGMKRKAKASDIKLFVDAQEKKTGTKRGYFIEFVENKRVKQF
ncbi:MAG TPA: hypothetical protein DIC46_03120 [Porphyromonadaceae bacterium]|nr:hypothetical protein [Porphyromonadaceae bacterium]